MIKPSKKNFIWLDLEMTGLSVEEDRIIEIATIVTDSQLNVLAEGPVIAVKQSDDRLEAMDEWNTRQHNGSGLCDRVKESIFDERYAEQATLEFLKKYVPKNASPMCGNSICQDRRFLHLYMPELCDHFHYRNLDVSTVNELCVRWNPELAKRHKKDSQHLALQDVRDSIDELKFYREHFIRPSKKAEQEVASEYTKEAADDLEKEISSEPESDITSGAEQSTADKAEQETNSET